MIPAQVRASHLGSSACYRAPSQPFVLAAAVVEAQGAWSSVRASSGSPLLVWLTRRACRATRARIRRRHWRLFPRELAGRQRWLAYAPAYLKRYVNRGKSDPRQRKQFVRRLAIKRRPWLARTKPVPGRFRDASGKVDGMVPGQQVTFPPQGATLHFDNLIGRGAEHLSDTSSRLADPSVGRMPGRA